MKVPIHIAVIMDGNGRWARSRGLPRTAGHNEGVERVKENVKEAKRLGVKMLTVFAFSTENWSRPQKEIDFLFSYLERFLASYEKELMDENIRLRFIGRRDRLRASTVAKIEALEKTTGANASFSLNIALDYGGRWDIVQAAHRIARDAAEGKVAPEAVTEATFGSYLALAGMPDPDLLIRTSGESRISNFLIWNTAYTEFYFTPVLWPDFDKQKLKEAIDEYGQRSRRFGALDE